MTSLIAVCGVSVLVCQQPAAPVAKRAPVTATLTAAGRATEGRATSELRPTVIVVVGAPGTKEYGRQFKEWAAKWQVAAAQGGADYRSIGLAKVDKQHDKTQLRELLRTESASVSSSAMWLVLIGHGTFDSRASRFNLRGPDVTAAELGSWLSDCTRPLAVVNCASSSGQFLKLASPNRVIVTATKSGAENNFARFGSYMASAIGDPSTDVDQDGQTSLLEAWLTAARQTQEFYATEGRLATEHSLLDDNGDGQGVRGDWFRGVRAVGKSDSDQETEASLDGLRAHQWHLVPSAAEQRLSVADRRRRDALEIEIFKLRGEKRSLPADEYFA
ncbi:MAG: hypothetical protein O3A00_15445, partial [Planctomycetota bacterium]|nr:hypothetical protein [Planctomycetota bacterium]